jgi:hypothetical protein
MTRILITAGAILIALHGLIHLMGAVAYLRLADLEGLPYKTTLLGGNVKLGTAGMAVFGALWLLPMGGFVAAAIGLLAGSDWWRPLLIAAAVFSLALTSLDWSVAFRGGLIDAAILAALAVGPRIVAVLR